MKLTSDWRHLVRVKTQVRKPRAFAINSIEGIHLNERLVISAIFS